MPTTPNIDPTTLAWAKHHQITITPSIDPLTAETRFNARTQGGTEAQAPTPRQAFARVLRAETAAKHPTTLKTARPRSGPPAGQRVCDTHIYNHQTIVLPPNPHNPCRPGTKSHAYLDQIFALPQGSTVKDATTQGIHRDYIQAFASRGLISLQ